MLTLLIALYCLLAIFLIVFSKESSHKYIYFAFCLLLIFLAGLRPQGFDPDYEQYLKVFYNGSKKSRIEPTFFLITNLVKSLFNHPIFLFLIYSIIGVSLKFIGFKQLTKYYLFSAFLYLCNYFLLHEMTQIRVGVASGLLLLCIKPLYNRDLKKFLLFIILAISFHYSALILVPLWFMNVKKINKKIYISIIPVMYLLVLSGVTITFLIEQIPIDQVQFLFKMYQFQMKSGKGGALNIFNVLQLIRCCMAIFMIFNISLIAKNNKYSFLLIKIYVISLLSLPLFSDVPVIGFRISELMGVVEVILIPLLISVFVQKRIAKVYIVIVGALMLFMNLFYTQLFSFEWY